LPGSTGNSPPKVERTLFVLLCEQKHQSLSPGFYVVHLDFLFEIRNHQYKTKTIIKREASQAGGCLYLHKQP